MATVADVITYARQLAQTDSNGITDVTGLAFSTDALQDMTRELIFNDIDAAQTSESKTNLTTTNPNTYAWPSDMFALKTIEVDFTGSGASNYLQASPVEVANLQKESFDWLRLNQSTGSPLFDNRGDTFEIFPVPSAAVTNGLKIFYFIAPTDYSGTGTTIAYPQSLDYRCLSAKVAYFYALSLEKQTIAVQMEAEYQKRLNRIINILKPSSQQPIKPAGLHITGFQF